MWLWVVVVRGVLRGRGGRGRRWEGLFLSWGSRSGFVRRILVLSVDSGKLL